MRRHGRVASRALPVNWRCDLHKRHSQAVHLDANATASAKAIAVCVKRWCTSGFIRCGSVLGLRLVGGNTEM